MTPMATSSAIAAVRATSARDLIGARATVELLKRYELKVPPIVASAATDDKKLYAGGVSDFGRTFVG